jgi:hypothetical protein
VFSDGHIIDLVVSHVRHYVFGCRGCKKCLWLPLERNGRHRNKYIHTTLALLAASALLTLLGLLPFAQGSPRVTGVDPSSGKVNDTVTVAGENLGKGTVSAIFLSDDKTDYKATLVEQDEEKIVMKVPHVRSGRYNISVQTGNAIYIQPVRFTVQE